PDAPSGRPYRGRRAEIDLACRDWNPFALGGADDQAARLVDGVEDAFDGGSTRVDGNLFAEPGRSFEPQLADLGKAAALVPDAAEFDPGVRQRTKQLPGGDLDAERVQ